jgi:hypothetical protein
LIILFQNMKQNTPIKNINNYNKHSFKIKDYNWH